MNQPLQYSEALRCWTTEAPFVPCTAQPLPTNQRYACMKAMDKVKDEEPWFGIEQEYTLRNATTKWPLGGSLSSQESLMQDAG